MKEVKAFKCSFCGKLYQKQYFCQNHEKSCNKNPDSKRACFDCIFCTMKSERVYFDSPAGDYSEYRKMLFCEQKGIFVYPPKIEFSKRRYGYKLGGRENIPMPKTCELREGLI